MELYNISPISIIKASAGSGKTYELSLHFLRLLKAQKGPTPFNLRKIVAITFTNKAASEMKERVLYFLKQIALETDIGHVLRAQTGLAPMEASSWIDTIIDNYSDFHVTTIDSLIFSIFKALAFELNLGPDMEVEFSVQRFVDEAFDFLIMSSDPQNNNTIIKVFDTYLTVENKRGFYPEKGIKKRLAELYGFLDEGLKIVELDLKRYTLARNKLKKLYMEFYLKYKELDNYLNKNKLRSLAPELSEGEIIGKKFWQNDFDSLFKKGMASKISGSTLQEFKNIFERLKGAAISYQLELARLAYYQAIGYVPILYLMSEVIDNIMKRDGVSLSITWTKKIDSYIKEKGFPIVYSFMGSRFLHFLFDEFQDTSRKQWNTLMPLFEEALSQGGSLFVVGDIKQAIYRWRGGDWKLFEELKHAFPSVSYCVERTLENNYRSHPQLVDFFNKLFSPLNDKQWIEECFSNIAVGRDILPEVRREFADSLSNGFKDLIQSPAREMDVDAQIRFYKITGDKDEILDQLKTSLVQSVSFLWKSQINKIEGSQVAVIVRTNDQAREVSSWLMEANLPVVTENSLNLWTSLIIRGIMCFLRLLIDPFDDVALYGFLVSGILQNGPRDEQDLIKGWYSDDAKMNTWKQEVLDKVSYVKRFMSFVSCYELIKLVLNLFGLEERLESGDLTPHKVFVDKFLEFAYESQVGNPLFLDEFVEFAQDGVMEVQIGLPEAVNAVRVITIHKAKGLEFSYVLVPFTDWRIKNFSPLVVKDKELVCLSSKADVLSEDIKLCRQRLRAQEAQELLNLFYVAVTRAKLGVYCYLFNTTKKGAPPVSVWIEELVKRSGLESFIKEIS